MYVLESANTLADVPYQPPERCHQLIGKKDEQFAVVVKDGLRIVFRPKHKPMPRKKDKGMDLSKITQIEILCIGDYHD